jgi:hypothetical protein
LLSPVNKTEGIVGVFHTPLSEKRTDHLNENVPLFVEQGFSHKRDDETHFEILRKKRYASYLLSDAKDVGIFFCMNDRLKRHSNQSLF